MSKTISRRLGLAAIAGAALALAGCATPFKADVARFQTQLPAPQGQSFAIEASNPALQGGIEFGQYANLVAGELTRYGYRPAANGERPDMVVRMDYGIDKGRERVVSTPGFGDPWYGGPGYPHCPPRLKRFGGILPFVPERGTGSSSPEHPHYYGPTGPLTVAGFQAASAGRIRQAAPPGVP